MRGIFVTVYKASFDKIFCENVKKGKEIFIQNSVQKYSPRKSIGAKGLNLLHDDDREILAQILCSWEEYVKLNFN